MEVQLHMQTLELCTNNTVGCFDIDIVEKPGFGLCVGRRNRMANVD